jgi:hypothetical protein
MESSDRENSSTFNKFISARNLTFRVLEEIYTKGLNVKNIEY